MPSRLLPLALGGVMLACTPHATRTSLVPTPRQAPSWALDRIDSRTGLDQRYTPLGTGQGVVVYVFDGPLTGLDHPELRGRATQGYVAFPDDTLLPQHPVCAAHATAVATTIAGRTLGVAPQAKVVSIQIIRCSDVRGTEDAILAGAEWVHATHPAGTPAVANWSFMVGPGYFPKIARAVQLLHERNILVVVAAGNVEVDACGLSYAPVFIPGLVVVGATTHIGNLDIRSPDTAYGDCVNIYAPVSARGPFGTDTLVTWEGTSFSTAYVSGAVALLLEQAPDISWANAYARLLSRATPKVVFKHKPWLSDSPDSRGPFLYVGR